MIVDLRTIQLDTEVGSVSGIVLITDSDEEALQISKDLVLSKSENGFLKAEITQNGDISFQLEISSEEKMISLESKNVSSDVLKVLGIASRVQKNYLILVAARNKSRQGFSPVIPEEGIVYHSEIYINGVPKSFEQSAPWPTEPIKSLV